MKDMPMLSTSNQYAIRLERNERKQEPVQPNLLVQY
jgi:hypothetical protein